MRGKLWCLRLTLLLIVSAVVLSPLAVRSASVASQPVGWNHDPSTLLLPSSPTYPAVLAYRDFRMFMAERSFEKAELLLDFANQDAAAIGTLARRQDFVSSASHASAYQETFDRCVGWLVIADERGNDMSYLLARVKNDHLAQQVALAHAIAAMPDWSKEGVLAARRHAAEVLVETIRLVEGFEAAQSYISSVGSMLPELELPSLTPEESPPTVVVVSPQTTAPETAETPVAPEETVAAPSIVSLDAQAREVEFGDSVRITCQLSGDDDDGLRFSWWCSRGDLVASRTKATWTAPHRAGIYEISVTVTDEQGQSDTRAVEIRVNDTEVDLVAPSDEGEQDNQQDDEPADPATSPEITGLTLTAEHNYLEQSLGGGYSILVSRECTIHCSVANPEELEIEWICTGGGTITGEGDTVTFKAPSMPGYSKVTVTVTNRDGEQDSVTTTIYVSTCTYCF